MRGYTDQRWARFSVGFLATLICVAPLRLFPLLLFSGFVYQTWQVGMGH